MYCVVKRTKNWTLDRSLSTYFFPLLTQHRTKQRQKKGESSNGNERVTDIPTDRMATNNSGNLRDDGNYTAAGKGQVCIPTSDKNLQFRKIKAITANQVCFDCPATRPTWASVTYGTFGLDAADLLTGVIRKCSCLTLFLNILVSLCDSL